MSDVSQSIQEGSPRLGLAERFPTAPEAWWRDSRYIKSNDKVRYGQHAGLATHFVLSGAASRARELANGRRQIIELLLPGDHVSAVDGDVQSGTVIACLGRCTVSRAPAAELLKALDSSISLQVEFRDAEGRRRAMLEERIVSLGQRTALERTAHFCCELLARSGEEQFSFASCACPFTQAELADLLGVSLVHMNRTLQALRKITPLELLQGRLTVQDYSTLAAYADFDDAYLR